MAQNPIKTLEMTTYNKHTHQKYKNTFQQVHVLEYARKNRKISKSSKCYFIIYQNSIIQRRKWTI